MDPFLEKNPIFHEIHTQFLAEAQRLLQPQLRPKYIGVLTLERKEPDLTLTAAASAAAGGSTATLLAPLASRTQELDADEQELRKQRRIVIYVNAKPRLAVTTIELLSPSNKAAGTVGQARYLEKRASALHGGLHWVEIDLLRSGERPPVSVALPRDVDYRAYVAQATPTGWQHLVYGWGLRDPFQPLGLPLLGGDQAVLDLGTCFRAAYDSTAADEEAGYDGEPPLPPLTAEDAAWVNQLLRDKHLR
jgi:hypothetical protein